MCEKERTGGSPKGFGRSLLFACFVFLVGCFAAHQELRKTHRDGGMRGRSLVGYCHHTSNPAAWICICVCVCACTYVWKAGWGEIKARCGWFVYPPAPTPTQRLKMKRLCLCTTPPIINPPPHTLLRTFPAFSASYSAFSSMAAPRPTFTTTASGGSSDSSSAPISPVFLYVCVWGVDV